MAAAFSRRRLLLHPLGLVATGFGSGLSRWAPGTVGTLAALLPWWFLMRDLPLLPYLGVLVAAFLLGMWASRWTISTMGVDDPGLIVWDEFVGVWIALLMVPAGWPWVLAGFVLFRIFDIAKPWPAGWADRHVHGGLGVMLDDAVAGIYALAVLQLLAYFLPG